ncbi:MAG TPA: glycoside hydrolase domain-containing protein [Terriglobia bacterium]|nr:glycoside hydrolase domain-containing protein [Terriglobia bacterium]
MRLTVKGGAGRIAPDEFWIVRVTASLPGDGQLMRLSLFAHCLLWLFASIGLLLAEPPQQPPQADPAYLVWVENPMVRVRPTSLPTASRLIEIAAARNEVEPFQVVITARSQKLDDVTVTVSDLSDGRGHRLEKAAITLFREHFVYVRNPSPYSAEPPGWWPDALIPFYNPVDGKPLRPMQLNLDENESGTRRNLKGARFIGSPFDVWPGQNQPIWAEVSVPTGAVPGSYRGSLTVSVPQYGDTSVEIKLQVWDFVLPDGTFLATHFGSLNPVAISHNVAPESASFLQLFERYAAALSAHRIDPPIPDALRPPLRSDGSIDWKRTHEELKRYIGSHHLYSIQIPQYPYADPLKSNRRFALRYLQSYYDYLKANGWEKGAYYYPVDEPNTREAYQQVRAFAQLAHEANPNLRVLCTEQTYPQDKNWGELRSFVDIWCPLFAFYDDASARSVRREGNEVWVYTALCQKAPPFHPEFPRVGGLPTLFWEIDFPLLNYRLPLWLVRSYRIKGLFYWSTVEWGNPDRDVWTDPAFRNHYNGEGYLFYPGSEAGISAPVASLRLKALREGMEDYAYFALLARLGDQSFLDSELSKISSSWWKWDADPDHLYEIRKEIAQRIMDLMKRSATNPRKK